MFIILFIYLALNNRSVFFYYKYRVDDIYDIKESPVTWGEKEERISKFLFIGSNLVKNELIKLL